VKAFLTIVARQITSAFQEVYLENEGNHFRVDEKMDIPDVIRAWLDSLEVAAAGKPGGFDQKPLPRAEETEKDPYRRVILNSASYKWLVTSLRQELLLEAPRNSLQSQISKEIASQLKPVRISRRQALAPCEVFYQAQWDPLAFCKEQGYPGQPEAAIGNALTLTRGDNNVELLTCSGYVSRTWPLIGEQVLHFLKGIIKTRNLLDNKKPIKNGEIQHILRG
jgi:hypothetical protein